MWKMKSTEVPMVIGTLWGMTPKLGTKLQQISANTSEISAQKSAALSTAEILCRTFKDPLIEKSCF